MIRSALRFGSACLLFTLLIRFAAPAHAVSFVVSTLADGGVGSLRNAINQANITAGADTITFSGNGTITLLSALPGISDDLTITGNGAANTIIDGAGRYRVFNIASGVTVNLSGLTVQNGGASGGSGGGIYNQGTLTVTNSTFSGNQTFAGVFSGTFGGGIANDGGTLTVTNSTFSQNSGAFGGGGIANISGGPVTVTNSTFSQNSGGFGGGIANISGGPVTVTNSTFSQNSAGVGGGIYNAGTLTVTNSTFSQNSVGGGSGVGGGGIANGGTLTVTNSTLSGNSATGGSGGGIYNVVGTTTLNNSLVANSSSGGDCYLANGTVNASHSLIMDSTNACGLTNGTNGNIVGSDPLLGSLTGSPAYFPLLSGSPAIDTGDNTLAVDASNNPLTTDEAGNARIINGVVDLGAYESPLAAPHLAFVQPPTDTLVSTTITPAVTVAVEDAANAIVTSATDAITLVIGTNPGGGTLGGTLTVNAVNGVATFSDLSIDMAGTGYTLTASASGLTGATSAAFNITTTPPPSTSGVTGAPISNLCQDVIDLSDSAITVSGGVQNVVLNGVAGNTYCRLIALDSQYVTSASEIGIQSVIDLGVVAAVDVFGQLPAGETVVPFVSPVTVCLRGSGDVLFLSAAGIGRSPQHLASTVSGDYTCVSVPNSGTVVLVGQASNLPVSRSANTSSAASTALANCRVTTLNAPLNLRSDPNTGADVLAQLPYNLTLTATAYSSGWYQVIYHDGQGWVSAQYLSTAGDCGG